MRQVLIHAPRFRLCRCHGDPLPLRVVKQIIPSGKGLVELRDTPGSDDLDAGLQSVESEFETDLIVAFSGTAVRDELAFLFLSHGDLGTGDDGTSERGAEEIDVFVDGIAGDGWVAELFDELSVVRTYVISEYQRLLTSLRRSSM